MNPSSDILTRLLRQGETAPVAGFFNDMPESQRQGFAPTAVAWWELVILNWQASLDRRAKQKLASLEKLPNFFELSPAAYAAVLACASFPQIKKIDFETRLPPSDIVKILGNRRPPWLSDYAEFVCGSELRRGIGPHWQCARALVRAGLCPEPQHPNYALGALDGIWPPVDWRAHQRRIKSGLPPLPEPVLADLLLAERDWLDTAFWKLFEFEGSGEVSLGHDPKKGSPNRSWSATVVELSRRGVLSRSRLLDASLAALARDFIPFRSGWFSRLHEALQPTPAERMERARQYLGLLGSRTPATVAFALDAVAELDQAQPLPSATLLPALELALPACRKIAAKTALGLLDALAAREPAARQSVCCVAISNLLHETADAQKLVFQILERHGDKANRKLRNQLATMAEAVVPSLRPQLALWGEISQVDALPKTALKMAATRKTEPHHSLLDASRALEPIITLDELLAHAARVLEDPQDPMDMERLLAGICHFNGGRPADFAHYTAPLRQRARHKRDATRGGQPRFCSLERALAMVLLTWIDQEDSFVEPQPEWDQTPNAAAFLFQRMRAFCQQIATGSTLPLLSTPTHRGGWIAPEALVKRWLGWQRADRNPDLHDQILSLLRLAPESRSQALPAAKALQGEAGDALRLALGETRPTGRHAALWLAAWRSRQPSGDLPEFEQIHPQLGPDAGQAAQYSWKAETERHQGGDNKWTLFELSMQLTPQCPSPIDGLLLPVLLHASCPLHAPLLRWIATFWPAHREAFFAQAVPRIARTLNYSEVLDQHLCACLETLMEPFTEMRPMACLALALALASRSAYLRGHAQEVLIETLNTPRLPAAELGLALARLLDTGDTRLVRWSKSLAEVARVSPAHAAAVADLISRALHANPELAPNNLSALLDLLVELLCRLGAKLEDPQAREYLARLSAGGKTRQLARQLLAG